jgi:hypothetical protein
VAAEVDGVDERANGEARAVEVGESPVGTVTEEAVDVVEPSADVVDGVDEVGQPHVPVKKKGARKR